MMLIKKGNENYGLLLPLSDTILKCHVNVLVHN